MIDTLIDKQDNFEVVRDQIAAILVLESNEQQQLAITAGKDPALWKLRVFRERSNPWEEWLNTQQDQSPIVNVWYDNSNFNMSASNIVERQLSSSVFNIDIYGYGKSHSDGSGHKPGDREAALNAQRATRLVRNILMSANYTYLNLRGLVWQRWPQSISQFQPQLNNNALLVVGARIAFQVDFNEFSPQFSGNPLELISIVVDNETGEILINADYEYT